LRLAQDLVFEFCRGHDHNLTFAGPLRKHATIRAGALALDKAGSSRAARMAIMAIMTGHSIKVKPECPGPSLHWPRFVFMARSYFRPDQD
jgi:hypothetical protein